MSQITSSNISSNTFEVLTTIPSAFQEASPLDDTVLTRIISDKTSLGLTNNITHLSLGLFYIEADLIEPHKAQRPIVDDHAKTLMGDFEIQGILRNEKEGVVIGLGDGWNKMRNTGTTIYKITKTTPFLDELSLTPGGPIAQVIRGGHRTEAIKLYSALPGNSEENYWLYKVLLPVTNTFPPNILLDYSILGNLDTRYRADSAHRITSTYAKIAASVYASDSNSLTITSTLSNIVKRHNDNLASVKIMGFKNLLRYAKAVPLLDQLLEEGGVWTVNGENAYQVLVKCKVEEAICYVLNACVSQTRRINNSRPQHKKYTLDELLPGGEKSWGKSSRPFGDGTRKGLEKTIKPNTPMYEAINTMVWESPSQAHIFGHLFLNPTIVQKEDSPIGMFLSSFRCIYCVIILFFLGPTGYTKATPQGGQPIDRYPLEDENHLEGVIKQHWMQNKVENSDLDNFSKVSLFIFQKVIGNYRQLEEDRKKRLSFVLKPLDPKMDVLLKLKELLRFSPTWKTLIILLRDQVMSLFPDYMGLVGGLSSSHSITPSSHLPVDSGSTTLSTHPPPLETSSSLITSSAISLSVAATPTILSTDPPSMAPITSPSTSLPVTSDSTTLPTIPPPLAASSSSITFPSTSLPVPPSSPTLPTLSPPIAPTTLKVKKELVKNIDHFDPVKNIDHFDPASLFDPSQMVIDVDDYVDYSGGNIQSTDWSNPPAPWPSSSSFEAIEDTSSSVPPIPVSPIMFDKQDNPEKESPSTLSTIPTTVDTNRLRSPTPIPATVDTNRLRSPTPIPTTVDTNRLRSRTPIPTTIDTSRLRSPTPIPTTIETSRLRSSTLDDNEQPQGDGLQAGDLPEKEDEMMVDEYEGGQHNLVKEVASGEAMKLDEKRKKVDLADVNEKTKKTQEKIKRVRLQKKQTKRFRRKGKAKATESEKGSPEPEEGVDEMDTGNPPELQSALQTAFIANSSLLKNAPPPASSSNLTHTPPPIAHTRISPPATRAGDLYTEARFLFKNEEEKTVSGLTTDQGSRILGAFLSMTERDRDAFLAMGHDEMALGLNSLVSNKRKGVDLSVSPEHKRTKKDPPTSPLETHRAPQPTDSSSESESSSSDEASDYKNPDEMEDSSEESDD